MIGSGLVPTLFTLARFVNSVGAGACYLKGIVGRALQNPLDRENVKKKTFISKALYSIRDLRSGTLFRALRRHCRGSVLDVGGWDFYVTALRKHLPFRQWTVLEVSDARPTNTRDRRVRFVVGDGCHMGFRSGAFDTVLSIQVLEHAFEPLLMINEMCRVVKDSGMLILLVPQTSTLHMAPHHYYNFTRFFLEEAMRRSHMRIIELTPLGGTWSSMASRLFYFFLQAIRFPGMSIGECKRSIFFYLLFPFMVVFVGFALPFCLLFALGDLAEEPNNHLVVACREPEGRGA
jgi:SAM-dependent methyltransferase